MLRIRDMTKIFGPGCQQCHETTGPDPDTNVCGICGSVVACYGVSFDLYRNEALGIVGESGSGKSTMIRTIHFDHDPTSGELYLDFSDMNSKNSGPPDLEDLNIFRTSRYRKRQARNQYMGIVYQNPNDGLRMNISSGGNVAERLFMAGWKNVGRIRSRALELFERTEAPGSRMDEPPINFSGGMRQRVQIAKALSNEPALLLLDEVTTGLDVSVQAKALDLIRNIQRELRLSMIVVSHDLGVIRMLTTRTIVMKNGRIVESGLTDQILEDPQHPYTQLLVSSIL